jgi:hypothetical protein
MGSGTLRREPWPAGDHEISGSRIPQTSLQLTRELKQADRDDPASRFEYRARAAFTNRTTGLGPTQQRVLGALAGPMTVNELARVLDQEEGATPIDKDNLRKTLKALHDGGHVFSDGEQRDKRWFRTPQVHEA